MIIYWDKKTNSKNRIGQRVKELRKAHNLTQKTLAAKSLRKESKVVQTKKQY